MTRRQGENNIISVFGANDIPSHSASRDSFFFSSTFRIAGGSDRLLLFLLFLLPLSLHNPGDDRQHQQPDNGIGSPA